MKKTSQKQKSQVKALKDNCSLFSRLYIACQSRDEDLEDFLKHENQPWPPSLAKLEEVRSGTKADLLLCLEKLMQAPEHCPPVDALILDGAVIVQMLVPKPVNTFGEYFENIFKPYILKQLQTVVRLDVIYDVYRQDSLKGATGENRGTGIRRRVKLTTHIPENWQSFLRVNENKTELSHLLAEQLHSIKMDGKEFYCTLEDQVLSSPNLTQDDKVRIEPCTHEEADTRIMLQVADAAEHGF